MRFCAGRPEWLTVEVGIVGRNRALVAGLLAFVSLGAGCGGQPENATRPSAARTPVQEAYSWFRAIDSGDATIWNAYFEPGRSPLAGGNFAGWGMHSAVRCRLLNENGSRASVYCSFNESGARGNPDTWWTIAMRREAGGPWLVQNWGQG